LWLIPLCGYVAGQDSQNQGALTMFTALYWWVPLGLSALLLLLACFWNIEKDTKAIEAKKIPAVPDSKLIS
jgi:Na+/melibiose symporter-like transporter